MAPALVIIAVGVDPTRALVLSQVVLSFGIPFALIPLLIFCRNRGLMGRLVNRRSTTVAAVVVATVIISLNALPARRRLRPRLGKALCATRLAGPVSGDGAPAAS